MPSLDLSILILYCKPDWAFLCILKNILMPDAYNK